MLLPGFFTGWATREAQRILEWVAYPFSNGSSLPRNWTGDSCIAGGFFTCWATRVAPLSGRWISLSLWTSLVILPALMSTLGFPGSSAGQESTCNAGDLGSIPGLGRFPREGKGYSFQYSGLDNSKDCIVHGVTKSQTRLSDLHPNVYLACLAKKDSFLWLMWIRNIYLPLTAKLYFRLFTISSMKVCKNLVGPY